MSGNSVRITYVTRRFNNSFFETLILRLPAGVTLEIDHTGNNITALHFSCDENTTKAWTPSLLPLLTRIPTIEKDERINAYYGKRLLALAEYINHQSSRSKISRLNSYLRLEQTRSAIAAAKSYEAYLRKTKSGRTIDAAFDTYVDQVLFLLETCCDTPSLLEEPPLLTKALLMPKSSDYINGAQAYEHGAIYGSAAVNDCKIATVFTISTFILFAGALWFSAPTIVLPCAIFMGLAAFIATFLFVSALYKQAEKECFYGEGNIYFEQHKKEYSEGNSIGLSTLNILREYYDKLGDKGNVSLSDFFDQINDLAKLCSAPENKTQKEEENATYISPTT